MGNKSKYDPVIATAICKRLAAGRESLRKICEDPAIPVSEHAVRQWALDDVQGFASHYARARLKGYEVMADDVLETAETPLVGATEVYNSLTGYTITKADMLGHRRLVVDTKKWLLSKVLPKIYGDKLSVEHSGTVSIEDRLRAGRARVSGTDDA